MEEAEISVTSPDHNTTDNSVDTITSTLSTLCEESRTIRKNICSVLKKTCFSDVDSSMIIGRGSTKISKQYLATNLINLVRLAGKVDPTGNSNVPILSQSMSFATQHDSDNVQKSEDYMEAMEARLERHDANLRS